MVSARKWRLTVFREMPSRLATSLMETRSRRYQRRIMPSNATSITPIPYSCSKVGLCSIRGSILDANYGAKWVSFGCKSTCSQIHGYWWLAFTWENLLFSCPACNRSEKNNKFPLGDHSTTLQPEEQMPGLENPLLLNPGSTINPVEHIQFVLENIAPTSSLREWWARPRDQSHLGQFTIEICGLNHSDLRELRSYHFENTISSHINAINRGVSLLDPLIVQHEFNRTLELLNPTNLFVGFTYDALVSSIPNQILQASIQRN